MLIPFLNVDFKEPDSLVILIEFVTPPKITKPFITALSCKLKVITPVPVTPFKSNPGTELYT